MNWNAVVDSAQIVGAIAGVAAILLWLLRPPPRVKKREIVFEERSAFQPFQRDAHWPNLELRLQEDRILKEPYVSTVRVRNRGSSAITAEDFESPIVMQFSPAEVVAVQVTARSESQPQLGIESFEKGEVRLTKALLNADEWVEFQVLLEHGNIADFDAHTRVKDGTIATIRGKDDRPVEMPGNTFNVFIMLYGTLMPLVYLFVYAWLILAARDLPEDPTSNLLATYILVSFWLSLIGVMLAIPTQGYSFLTQRRARRQVERQRRRSRSLHRF
jgi:hypothetical protein